MSGEKSRLISCSNARGLAGSLVEARRLGGRGSASPRGPNSSRLVESSTDWDGYRITYWMRLRGGSHGIVGEGVFRTKRGAGGYIRHPHKARRDEKETSGLARCRRRGGVCLGRRARAWRL